MRKNSAVKRLKALRTCVRLLLKLPRNAQGPYLRRGFIDPAPRLAGLCERYEGPESTPMRLRAQDIDDLLLAIGAVVPDEVSMVPHQAGCWVVTATGVATVRLGLTHEDGQARVFQWQGEAISASSGQGAK